MKIIDSKGKYILEVDDDKKIVYGQNIGYWKPEDLERFHTEFVEYIYPIFEGKEWRKVCNFTECKASMITEKLKQHVKIATDNGLVKIAVVLNENGTYTPILKAQIKKCEKFVLNGIRFFYCENNAKKWISE